MTWKYNAENCMHLRNDKTESKEKPAHSTYERLMQDEEFKARFDKEYAQLIDEEESIAEFEALRKADRISNPVGVCQGDLDPRDEDDPRFMEDFCGHNPEDFKRVHDEVHHPKHYNSYKNIEVIELTSQLDFCRGSALKYICRAGLKDKSKEIEDLEKAIWYLNYSIKMLKENSDDERSEAE